jgi:hypothetical protein
VVAVVQVDASGADLARAVAAITSAPGTSRSGRPRSPAACGPAPASEGPSRRTIRRSIAAARGYSISCSQIAHASASNGSGRRRGRSHGQRRTSLPISGSSRKRA